MKKHIGSVLPFLVILLFSSGCGKNPLLSTMPAAAGGTGSSSSLFSEDFNSIAAGIFNGNSKWVVSNYSGLDYKIDATTFRSSLRSLQMNGTYIGYTLLASTLRGSSVVHLEYYLYISSGSDGGAIEFYSGTNFVAAVGAAYGYYAVQYTLGGLSSNFVSTTTIAPVGSWHKINFNLDTSKKTWSLLIDDVAPTTNSNGAFNQNGTLTGVIDGIKLISYGVGNFTSYYDDIKITQ